MESSSINFCQTKLISVCNANDKYQQKYCVFYTKSSVMSIACFSCSMNSVTILRHSGMPENQ